MAKQKQPPQGRPRGQQPASPELAGMSGVQLARWGAAACAGGLTQRSAASLAGVSRRHLQRLLSAYGADPQVARDQALAAALRWEGQAGQALEEAVSRSLAWLRRCEAEGADLKETGAALAATIASAHRLGEAGSRRAKRLQALAQPAPQAFDVQAFLGQIAEACQEVRQMPEAEQAAGWALLHQQLKPVQQPNEPAAPIDVMATAVEP